MTNSCAIVTGGDSCDISKVKKYHYIIACDKGLEYCVTSGIQADIALGDFDSYRGEVVSSVRTIGYPRDKADTDTMLAVKHAMDRGYKTIDIYCALGGRLDHAVANLQTVAYATSKGVCCRIIGDDDFVYCVDSGSIVIDYQEGYCLSVLAHSSTCCGVSITSAKYELAEANLSNTVPIGVSNEFVGDHVKVTVQQGCLFVILSRKQR